MSTFQDLNKTVEFLSAKYDDLLLQFWSINDKTQRCNQDIANIKKYLSDVNTCAVNAGIQAEELAQYLRRDCLEISGPKATNTCSAEAIVKSVVKAIGVAVLQNDISIAHPIPSYNRDAPPKIIVKFTQREVRNKFYSNRRKLAKKKVKDLPDLQLQSTDNIYVSESLTPYKKRLFASVNKPRKRMKWKYIWTNNARIYIKEGAKMQKMP
ncbi:Hypothetical predicted protein [Paramuricea clavata]|uniref:Uncharacterized protein n=1 Tax=Paramuricea clavata TaxID=317549 RepID=A0A7D9HN88_PARCT|nr:Hypothetical predicted protein [Paramuricea clavata]